MSDVTVISLGGSLLFPGDNPDIEFLRSFRDLILKYVAEGRRFVLITGGGKICRKYQDALGELVDMTSDDKDWMGIYTTRTNGRYTQFAFKGHVDPELYLDPSDLAKWSDEFPVAVGAGWKPGWSTDYDAVEMAHIVGAKKVINLSNIAYAYTKDPREFPDAQKLERVTWDEYRSYIPAEWTPGLSTPFDPIASKKAQEFGIDVAIIDGSNLASLEACLADGEFEGTSIVCEG